MLLTVVFTEKTVTIKLKSNSFQYLMRRKLSEKSIFKTQIFKSKYKIGPEEESKSENVHVQRLSKIVGLDKQDSSKGTKT